jgi:hypothetical protein
MLKSFAMSRITTTLFGAAVAFFCGGAEHVAAQSRDMDKRLQAATRVVCTFSTVATADWDGGAAQASVEPTETEAEFHEINIDEGTAEAGSDFGDSFISVRYSGGYLHFMQISDVGPLYVTTILAQESSGGRFMAIQSRLDYAISSLPAFAVRPQMYVGDCEVTTR